LLCSAYSTNKAECTLGSKTGWRSVAALTTSLQNDNFSFQKLLHLSCRLYQLLHTVHITTKSSVWTCKSQLTEKICGKVKDTSIFFLFQTSM
jgi:hypothetical protein